MSYINGFSNLAKTAYQSLASPGTAGVAGSAIARIVRHYGQHQVPAVPMDIRRNSATVSIDQRNAAFANNDEFHGLDRQLVSQLREINDGTTVYDVKLAAQYIQAFREIEIAIDLDRVKTLNEKLLSGEEPARRGLRDLVLLLAKKPDLNTEAVDWQCVKDLDERQRSQNLLRGRSVVPLDKLVELSDLFLEIGQDPKTYDFSEGFSDLEHKLGENFSAREIFDLLESLRRDAEESSEGNAIRGKVNEFLEKDETFFWNIYRFKRNIDRVSFLEIQELLENAGNSNFDIDRLNFLNECKLSFPRERLKTFDDALKDSTLETANGLIAPINRIKRALPDLNFESAFKLAQMTSTMQEEEIAPVLEGLKRLSHEDCIEAIDSLPVIRNLFLSETTSDLVSYVLGDFGRRRFDSTQYHATIDRQRLKIVRALKQKYPGEKAFNILQVVRRRGWIASVDDVTNENGVISRLMTVFQDDCDLLDIMSAAYGDMDEKDYSQTSFFPDLSEGRLETVVALKNKFKDSAVTECCRIARRRGWVQSVKDLDDTGHPFVGLLELYPNRDFLDVESLLKVVLGQDGESREQQLRRLGIVRELRQLFDENSPGQMAMSLRTSSRLSARFHKDMFENFAGNSHHPIRVLHQQYPGESLRSIRRRLDRNEA